MENKRDNTAKLVDESASLQYGTVLHLWLTVDIL